MLLGAIQLLWPGITRAQIDELWAVSSPDLLINFSASDPSICGQRRITGLFPGESIVGIDFRPGPPPVLYALANTGQLFVINDPGSGFTIPVRPGPLPDLVGIAFGVDFDPVADRLRVISDTDQNLLLDPDTGAATNVGGLAYAPADSNAGQDPWITAAAYTNSFDGAPSTTLYVIDPFLGVLGVVDQVSGTITTVGSLGVRASLLTGFDISGTTGTAYAVLEPGIISQPYLYTIDLSTGKATPIDRVWCQSVHIHGLTVRSTATPVDPSTWGRIKTQFAR